MAPRQLLSGVPRSAWILFAAETVLFLLFLGGLSWLWRSVPAEGVKLHGNIDTGVDLLGARQDLLWIGLLGGLVFVGNAVLAFSLAPREQAAAYFVLSATVPVLLLLIGTVVFLANLNRLR